MIHRLALITALSFLAVAPAPIPPRQDYATLVQRAEALYAEGSFELARRAYAEAAKQADEARPAIEVEAKRWVTFRLADCAWRQAAASRNPDQGPLDAARAELEELLRLWERPEERDATWASIHESLADWSWTRENLRDWNAAYEHYQEALGFWAASSELEPARARYLAIVRHIVMPEGVESAPSGWVGYAAPEMLEDAARIAIAPEDRAWTHFFLAQRLAQTGDVRSHRRVREAYEAVIALGRENEWADDALYALAVWLEERGVSRQSPERGTWTEPDYPAALELYRRFLAEYPEGESRYRDSVIARIENITKPQISVGVGQAFLPSSLQRYHLRWRNVGTIELALFPFDLARDVELDEERNAGSWLETVPIERMKPVRTWKHETGDAGRHEWGEAELELEEPLPLGAYVLAVSGAGERSRDLFLVSDAALVLKSYQDRVAVWFAGVADARPIPGARVRLFERDGHREPWRSHVATSDEKGLAIFELDRSTDRRRELFAAAVLEGRQAFGSIWSAHDRGEGARWMLYAFTDRAAYRPGQTVNWRLIARERVQGALSTPSGAKLDYELVNALGEIAQKGALELSPFGSAAGTFAPLESWPLGEYQLRFLRKGEHLAQAPLFRLEEYKLPEFTVAVEVPKDEKGRTRSYRVGEMVEAAVVAEYYFGGPVAEASVELLVHQRPFFHHWEPPREFPWYYDDARASRFRPWYGAGELVKREVLKTDAAGRALVRFETPEGAGQDFEYTIEARVTDASRREVSGSGSVRVTRQAYYIYPRVEHELFRPGASVEIAFRALDANDGPVEVEGRAALIRRRWREVWVDPLGREVEGEELEGARRTAGVFPPPVGRGRPWTIVRSEYEEEVVATSALRTDEGGEARWSVTVPREGYYAVRWTSADEAGTPIQAEIAFWVADEKTTELGYRGPGVEILADRDTFRSGAPGHVMLAVPASGRHVLFAVEAEDVLELRVVEVKGTVALLELAVDARWVPNVQLVAHTFSDGYGSADSIEIVVPPEEHFLEVELALEPAELLPGAPGEIAVLTRDRRGEPVAAEVSLALVDEAVSAIQADYAGDPRQFFFGEKRAHLVATSSSDQLLRYAFLVEGEKGGWRDAREVGTGELERQDGGRGRSVSDYDVELGYLAKNAAPSSRAREEGSYRGPSDSVAQSMAPAEADAFGLGVAGGQAGGGGAEIQVRSDFRETALWLPSVLTDSAGRGRVPIEYPDSLTNWKATARAATEGARFGEGRGTSATRKPLVARLQVPRFFVVGDEVTVSVNLNNRTDEPLAVRAELAVEGLRVLGFIAGGEIAERGPDEVTVPARGDLRLDWRVRAESAGTARFVAKALAESASDALEKSLPVVEHGIEVLEARAGRTEAPEVAIALDLPAERAPGSTRFEVQVTPSLAVTMLDALPYLVDYPYGCTEQTLSRFLPAVVVKRTLAELGLSAEVAMQRVFGGIEREHAETTQLETEGSLAALDTVVRAGLERLYDMQHGDGGWSWWKEGESDPFMTGYVVWGLALARDAGVEVRASALENGARRLSIELVEAEHLPDLQAWMLHALAAWMPEKGAPEERRFAAKAFEKAFANRGALNAYGRSLLALAAVRLGRSEEARALARNLIDGAIVDRAPDASIVQRGGAQGGTAAPRAHWGEDGIHHRWSEGGVEATAFALRALLAVDPAHELVDPAAQWLLANRRGAQWKNTRDTAIVVLALEQYLRAKKELDRTVEYEVVVNGSSIARRRLAREEILAAPASFAVPDELVRSGRNEVVLKRLDGEGPLYFAVHARFFSQEEPIPPRGNELFVRRQYFRLAGRPTLLRGYVYERVPLGDGERIVSGERVEVVLSVEAKTHLEHLVFEDHKPAGFEAAQVKSGEALEARELERGEAAYRFGAGEAERPGVGRRSSSERMSEGYTGRGTHVHQELRDRKVALFVEKLPEGVWEMRYDLRAEVPGRFHALPLVAHAMYVPEIRANGEEVRVVVEDRTVEGE